MDSRRGDYVTRLRAALGSSPILLCGVTVLIFDDEHRLLLQRRSDNGRWSCPGGMIEPGESVEEAAKREVMEEVALTLVSTRLVTVASGQDMYYRYPNGDEVYNVTLVLSGRVDSYAATAKSETLSIDWIAVDRLPWELLSPPTAVIFEKFASPSTVDRENAIVWEDMVR